MSDSEDSMVTYTTVSSPYEGRSGDVSPGVGGPPVRPKDPYIYVVAAFQALPPPDYVPGPEEPEQAPPSPVYILYVPKPVYPEYIPLEDDVFPAEEQPLLAAASPTAESPRYIPEFDPDEDLKEDDDEDPEEDPADYPANHDDKVEEQEPSRDDADEEDEEQDEDDDDEEEEHPASADSIPPPPVLRVTARISFRPQPPTVSFTKEDAERFLAMPIPPPSPLTPLSSLLLQIPSPPLPTSPHILLIPLPAASPPLQYEAGKCSVAAAARPIEGCRADYGFVDSIEAKIRRRRAEDIGYGIRDTWIDLRDVAEEEALTTFEGVNTRVTELAAVQEQDTQDIYRVMEDTQGRQTKIIQRVEALVDDSQYRYETGRLVDQEARCSREAWAHSIELSSAVHFKKMAPKKAAPKRTIRLNPSKTSNPNQAPSTTTTIITNAQLQAMIDQGVNAALAARDANRTGDDSHTSGTGVRRTERFFRISNCLAENQVKFATCTLLVGALTWWNSHVRIVGNDAAYVMTSIELKKKMANKYCPRNEMKKIETEFWNLEVQGTDVTRYNQRFQELALLCVRTRPEESDRVERYIGGLPDSIHKSVAASKPKTMQEATEMATGLMDKKIRTYAKRQDVARAYAAGFGNRQQYAGSRPLCPKCNFNHDGPCTPRCYKCNKIIHLSRDCRSSTNAKVANNQRGNGAAQKVTCYECGAQGHVKRYWVYLWVFVEA
nr:hypothetical protein [Tanacetum cinerariifolium]